MKQGLSWLAALAVVAVFVAGAVASENVFVVDEAKADTFDLADLNDGEVRVFGAGEDRITATREGDEVRLERDPSRTEGGLMLTCDLTSDSCRIITHDDSEDVMIRIERSRTTGTAQGHMDREIDVEVMAFDPGDGKAHRIVVRKEMACAGDDGCEERTIDLMVDEAGGNVVMIEADSLDPGKNSVIIRGRPHGLHHGDETRVVLRCPEGDTTMTVDEDEADEVYTCPKHGETLEKSGGLARRIWVEKKEEY